MTKTPKPESVKIVQFVEDESGFITGLGDDSVIYKWDDTAGSWNLILLF